MRLKEGNQSLLLSKDSSPRWLYKEALLQRKENIQLVSDNRKKRKTTQSLLPGALVRFCGDSAVQQTTQSPVIYSDFLLICLRSLYTIVLSVYVLYQHCIRTIRYSSISQYRKRISSTLTPGKTNKQTRAHNKQLLESNMNRGNFQKPMAIIIFNMEAIDLLLNQEKIQTVPKMNSIQTGLVVFTMVDLKVGR